MRAREAPSAVPPERAREGGTSRDAKTALTTRDAKCGSYNQSMKSNAGVRTRRETSPNARERENTNSSARARRREPAHAQYRCPNFSFSLKFAAYLLERHESRAFSSVNTSSSRASPLTARRLIPKPMPHSARTATLGASPSPSASSLSRRVHPRVRARITLAHRIRARLVVVSRARAARTTPSRPEVTRKTARRPPRSP